MPYDSRISNIQADEVARAFRSEDRWRVPVDAEAIWYLQWESHQDGGLRGLISRIMHACPDCVGTPTMRRLHRADDERYSLAELTAILKEFPEHIRAEDCLLDDFDPHTNSFKSETNPTGAIIPEMLDCICREMMLKCGPDEFWRWCQGGRPDNRSHVAWYMADLAETLRLYMHKRAEQERQSIVDTEVSRRVFRALEVAYRTRMCAMVSGESRIGKTEAASCWARMWPGKARLVTVAEDSGKTEFHECIARALGIEASYGRKNLKELNNQVLRGQAPMLVFDEAHYLWMNSDKRSKYPERISYLRSQLVDRGHPVVIVATHQEHEEAMNEFKDRTKYNVRQWLGRVEHTETLPGTLPVAEFRKLAKFYLPHVSEPKLRALADMAKSDRKSYTAFFRGIKKLALARCDELKANKIDDAILLDAVEWAFPGKPLPPALRKSGGVAPQPTVAESLVEDSQQPQGRAIAPSLHVECRGTAGAAEKIFGGRISPSSRSDRNIADPSGIEAVPA